MTAVRNDGAVPVIDIWAPIVGRNHRRFGVGVPGRAAAVPDVFTKTRVTADEFGAYAKSLRRSDEHIIHALDDAGIIPSLITGFDEKSTCGVTFVHNESVPQTPDEVLIDVIAAGLHPRV
jgi:hypothetical protein